LAATQFNEAVEALPNVPTIRYHLALNLYSQGAVEQAIAEMSRSLSLNVEFPEQQVAEELLKEWQQ